MRVEIKNCLGVVGLLCVAMLVISGCGEDIPPGVRIEVDESGRKYAVKEPAKSIEMFLCSEIVDQDNSGRTGDSWADFIGKDQEEYPTDRAFRAVFSIKGYKGQNLTFWMENAYGEEISNKRVEYVDKDYFDRSVTLDPRGLVKAEEPFYVRVRIGDVIQTKKFYLKDQNGREKE